MAIDPIPEPTAPPAQPWQFLDWSIGPDGIAMNSRRFVHKRLNLYTAAQGTVVVNEIGKPAARLRYCSQDDYNANLWQKDGLLVARDPNGSTMPQSTPITLSFATPLRAVGAYVVVGGDAVILDLPLDAVMWVQEAGSNTWAAIHGSGTVGKVLPAGTAASAAFVGAACSNGSRIGKVCFDASLAGSFETLALSRLFWVA
jgi:hypothetical protein